MKNLVFLTAITMFWSCMLLGQSLDQISNFDYQSASLSMVLKDINNRHQVQFAYSSSLIQMNAKVSYTAQSVTLKTAFDQIFGSCHIDYAAIGGQIALKPKPKDKLGHIQKVENKLPKSVPQLTPLYSEEEKISTHLDQLEKREPFNAFPAINHKVITSVPGGDRVIEFDPYQIEALTKEILVEDQTAPTNTRLAQVSLLPYVGTNALKSNRMTNNMSLNLLWGTNGGVDGLEVGGLMNHIKTDVKGVQVAGLGNTVGENVVGTQVSGLFNTANGHVEGVQLAGLFNNAEEADAVQVAGLFNNTNTSFNGVQIAGLYNRSGAGDAVQLAGLFNVNSGYTKSQIAGLFNIAGNVDGFQISPFLNRGKKVAGFQLGFINVADTISGIPFGMINVIKKGYNRVEIGSAESFIANSSIKVGVRRFYNIFHVGVNWESIPDLSSNTEQKAVQWGIGYGLGTSFSIKPWLWINLEAMTTHVNENEGWTYNLNLLNQIRLFADINLTRRMSLYFGPTANLMVSKLYDPDTKTYGSKIVPYSFYNQTTNETNTQMWIGFTGGLRF